MPSDFDPGSASYADHAWVLRSIGLNVVPARMPIAVGQWKRPLLHDWKRIQSAVVPDAEFTRWYGPQGQYRDHQNMGFLTGTPTSEGYVFWVLDLDTHKSSQAQQWLSGLLAVHNNNMTLATATHRTGGGGLQMIFRASDGWRPPTGKTLIGVDTRGVGGFAMLPPSAHTSGKDYCWLEGYAPWEHKIEVSPKWLEEAVDALVRPHCTEPFSQHEVRPHPQQPVSVSGRATDGREDKMYRQIWAVLVDLRRASPERPTEQDLLDSYRRYAGTVKSRLRDPGADHDELIEREGRGITLYRQKWVRSLTKWETDIAAAAAAPPPGRQTSQVAGQAQSPERSVDADSAAAEASEAISTIFREAERHAVLQQRWKAHKEGATGVWPLSRIPVQPSAPCAVARLDVGLGKTEIAIGYTILFVNGDLEGGGYYDKALVPRMVEYIVSDHRLAEEVTGRFNNYQPGVAHRWRGLGRDAPDGKGKMCRRFADMSVWLAAGGDSAKMCKSCAHRPGGDDPCAYLGQWKGERVIVVAAPDGLTTASTVSPLHRQLELPGFDKPIAHHADMIIVDETRIQNWVGGFDQGRCLVDETALAGTLTPPHGHRPTGWRKDDWVIWEERLANVSELLHDAHVGLALGETRKLTFGELRRVLPTADDWNVLASTTTGLLVRPDADIATTSGQSLRERLTATKSWNDSITSLAHLARVAAQALAVTTFDGTEYPDDALCPLITVVNAVPEGTGLLLSWRKSVNRLRSNVTTLVLDATADLKMLQHWKPSATLIVDARAALPATVDVIQVRDSLCTYRGWVPKSEKSVSAATSADETRRWNNVERLVHFLDLESAEAGGGSVGFIGAQGLEKALEARWRARGAGRPANIITGHFGAIAGLDNMKDVRTLVIWGRMSPPIAQIEALAGAAYSALIAPLGGPLVRGQQHYRLADGDHVRADLSEWHPDPHAEAMRAQIVDAELYQAIGRARPFRRTHDTRLKIIIGTSQPTSLPVTRLVTVGDVLWAGPIEALAARGVYVPPGPTNRGYAKLLAVALGISVDAVKSHMKRVNVSKPHKSTPMGVCHVEHTVTPANFIEFRLKLTLGDRFFTSVYLRPDFAENPEAALSAEGIVAAVLERSDGRRGRPYLLQPAAKAETALVLHLFRRHADALVNGVEFEPAKEAHWRATPTDGTTPIRAKTSSLVVHLGQSVLKFIGKAA